MTTHVELGASGAERWMACPGSVQLSRGIEQRESDYAKEGTAAHALAARCVQMNRGPFDYIGLYVGDDLRVTEEMATAVQVYVDYVNSILREHEDAVCWVERSVSLANLHPPAEMRGTADTIILAPAARTLYVIDYKHGAGVVKEAAGNPQTRYYALAAWASMFVNDHNVEQVVMVIVQPRAPHPEGIIRKERMALMDLLAWGNETLLPAAAATLELDAPLHAGSHCRFCPAAARCPELRNHSQLVAQSEFEAELVPDPRRLTDEELAHILDNADIIEHWLRAVRATAEEHIVRGGAVPGWKVVPKRSTRRWTDESNVVDHFIWLAKTLDVSVDDLYERKMKSPAQVERMLRQHQAELPEYLVTKTSSGLTLVPESDPRLEAALDPATEFAALPPASTDTSIVAETEE